VLLQAKQAQGTLALDFVNAMISSLEMNAQSATLLVKLYHLAKRSTCLHSPISSYHLYSRTDLSMNLT